jgi:predicted small metal-binding protein
VKRFSCGDVIPGCDATFTAPDIDGIFAQAVPHGAAVHGIDEVTPELAATVRAHIHDV